MLKSHEINGLYKVCNPKVVWEADEIGPFCTLKSMRKVFEALMVLVAEKTGGGKLSRPAERLRAKSLDQNVQTWHSLC